MLSLFTRPIEFLSSNPVRSSDAKRFRRRLQIQFELLSDEQLEEIWPPGEQLVLQKTAEKTCVYFAVDSPVFYTTPGSKEMKDKEPYLTPTLYLLHVAPQIMQSVVIYQGLLKKFQRGDALFMPGFVVQDAAAGQNWIASNFGRFEKDELRAIVEQDNWAPIAIGAWVLSSSELQYRGDTGKGMDIVHCVGDHLWLAGHGRIPKTAPASANKAKDAFTLKVQLAVLEQQHIKQEAAQRAKQAEIDKFITEAPKMIKKNNKLLRQITDLKTKLAQGQMEPNEDQRAKLSREAELVKDIADIEARVTAIRNPAAPKVRESWEDVLDGPEETPDNWDDDSDEEDEEGSGDDAADAAGADGEENADGGADAGPGADADTDAEAAAGGPEEPEEPAMTMDEVLYRGFLLALRISCEDTALPMLISAFYAHHIKPACQLLKGNPDLAIKQTKHKKISVFLEAMAKDGIIYLNTVKEGVVQITAVDRNHDEVYKFDADAFLEPVIEAEATHDVVSRGNSENKWQGALPKRGVKVVTIMGKKVRGNKNVTTIANLENFGIRLDGAVRKEMSKRFSVAVSYSDSADATAGQVVTVQGKYAVQLEKFITERFGIPKKHIRSSAKGASKRDKAINV